MYYRGLGALLIDGRASEKAATRGISANQVNRQSSSSKKDLVNQFSRESLTNGTIWREAICEKQLYLAPNSANMTNKTNRPLSAGRAFRIVCSPDVLGSLLPTSSLPNCIIMASTTKRADFEAVFPGLAKDILEHAKRYNLPANALEWFEKVGHYPISCSHALTRIIHQWEWRIGTDGSYSRSSSTPPAAS